MSESQIKQNARTPWHLWVIGIVAVLWNAMGALDYTMTEMRNQKYLSAMTAEQLAYIYAIPAWVIATWAIGVWGGVVGSMLLLLRRRIAVVVFLASLVGAAVTHFYNYVLSEGMKILGGPSALVFAGVIILVALGLFLYARAMQKRGILV